MSKPVTFAAAKAQYPHRFTMEHVPAWAREPAPSGKFYAPHFRSDREWYDNTEFPAPRSRARHCYTSGQTWPVGRWLDTPFTPAREG